MVKVPVHYDGQTHHNRHNPAAPLSSDEAAQWLAYHRAQGNGHDRRGEVGYIGVGFRPSPANRLVCLDLDDCADEAGAWSEAAKQWGAFFTGAALERSHGGRGLHVWFTHTGDGPGRRGKRETPAGTVEMYGDGQFIALGDYLGGDPLTDCTTQMQATLAAYFPAPTRTTVAVTAPDWSSKSSEQQAVEVANLRSALARLNPDDRDTWVAQGQALCSLGELGRELWEEWSATSEKFPGGSDLEKFDTFTGERTDYRAIFAKAQALGWYNPGAVVPSAEWTEAPAEGWRDTLSEARIDARLNGQEAVKPKATAVWGVMRPTPHQLWCPEADQLANPDTVARLRAALLGELMTMYGGNCAAVLAKATGHPLTEGAADLRGDVLRAAGAFLNWWKPVAEQRAAEHAAVVAVAEELGEPITPTVYTLDEVHNEMVYIREGQFVVVRKGAVVYRRSDAEAAFAASQHELAAEGDAKPKLVPCLSVWMKSKTRNEAGTLSWRPGQPTFCSPVESPSGQRSAYNTWRGFRDRPAPANWRDWAALFETHVAYLVPVEAERRRFLQWCAHMVQHPGELPHTAYLMVTDQTGTGRNWLASALGLALQGYAALGVNLGGILDGKFNGGISQKLLITVDEVREGVDATGNRHQRGEALKKIVTEERRNIDHKYGMQLVEQNCGRWLIFSNHLDALPFDNNDRRLIVIQNPSERQNADYYRTLYGVLKRPEFAASLFEYLRTLPLDGFNAGEPAPMNAAKAAALGVMLSPTDRAALAFIAEWPGTYATDRDLRNFIRGELNEVPKPTVMAHVKRRAGIVTLEGVRPWIHKDPSAANTSKPVRETIIRLRPVATEAVSDTIVAEVLAGRVANPLRPDA